jgi:hypothetical protein
MYKKIIVLFILFLFSECKQKPQGYTGIPVIDIVEGIEDEGTTMLLSEVAEDITFIPLETTDECLVSDNISVNFHKDYIIVKDNSYAQILLFDNKGKFIRKIGNMGQGPGEYLYPLPIGAVNDEFFVYDLNMDRTLCYSLHTGQCLRTRKNNYNAPPQQLWCFNDSVLVYYYSIPTTEDPATFAHIKVLSLDFETENELWHEKFQSVPDTENKTYEPPERAITYLKDGNIYMLDTNIDDEMVYCVNKNFEKIPAYRIPLGKNSKGKKYKIYNMIDTDRFVFIVGALLPNQYYRSILYDKTTGKSKHIISDFGPPWGFHNDIDGSIPIWPRKTASRNVLLDVISPPQLRELMSHPYYKTIEIKNKEKHQAIKDYLNSAEEDANPVIFLVTMK